MRMGFSLKICFIMVGTHVKSNLSKHLIFMKKHNEKIVLGIGRPRCGFLTIDNENKILHTQTKGNSPVNMGIKTNTGFLLGHSDGTITEMNGDKCEYIQCGNDSITAMFSTNISWQVGDSKGCLFSSYGWKVDLEEKISSIVETEDYIWVSTISVSYTHLTLPTILLV